jgi:hypothetical protein
MAVRTGEVAALLIAAEAAADSRRKMEQALYARAGRGGAMPVFRCFSAAELGLALGRADVIHAAVLQSPAGRSFVEAATRLRRYDGVGDEPLLGETNEAARGPQDV